MAKKKNNYLWIGIAVVAVIVLAFIFMSGNNGIATSKASYSDVEISDFKWERCWNSGESDCNNPPIYYSGEDGLVGEGNLVLYSSKENLYAKVWVNGEMSQATDDYPKSLSIGDNRVHLWSMKLNSLYGNVNFKICFSGEREFNEYSENVICKEESFSLPKISVSVSPDPLSFSINKDDFEYPRKTITITNTGEVPTHFSVLLPSSAVESFNYPKYYPQYPTFGFTDYPSHFPNPDKEGGGMVPGVTLFPGESAKYDVGITVGNVGEYDTPIDTYTSTGYVYSFYYNNFDQAQYKKEFNINAEVN